jgi:type VI secretion system protein ImpE
MDAATLVREGKPLEALAALEGEVRAQPAEARHRLFLFQLLCVLGDWDRAANQIQVAAELDASMLVLANVYRSAIRSELLREAVFAGRRSPLLLGEPEPWVGDVLAALQAASEGRYDSAMEQRDRALEVAPVVGGVWRIGESDPQPFEWIADGDSRLGPIAEIILEGRYYWVPFSRIRTLRFEPPADLRDLVWMPCDIVWTNGGDASGLMPVRYPGVRPASEPALQMARTTRWAEPVEGYLVGEGSRVLVSEHDEATLLDLRAVEQEQPESPEDSGG